MHNNSHRDFVAALHFKALTPYYDLLMKIFMREKRFKEKLLSLFTVTGNAKILDLGCGTGTLAIMAKEKFMEAEIEAFDCDEEILAIGAKKAESKKLQINFKKGFAPLLPYPDQDFNIVLSTLTIHHLKFDEWEISFREVLRVLKPEGEFYIVDFGPPANFLMKTVSGIANFVERYRFNLEGKISSSLENAGFREVSILSRINTLFGTLDYYKAIK